MRILIVALVLVLGVTVWFLWGASHDNNEIANGIVGYGDWKPAADEYIRLHGDGDGGDNWYLFEPTGNGGVLFLGTVEKLFPAHLPYLEATATLHNYRQNGTLTEAERAKIEDYFGVPLEELRME